jgi:hypothetical protein
VLLLRLNSSDGSGNSSSSSSSSSGGIGVQSNHLVHELPLPKGPDDKSPDVIRRTVSLTIKSFEL